MHDGKTTGVQSFWNSTIACSKIFKNYFSIIRAFSSSLLRVIIARNNLPFFKIFSNFVYFCPIFQICDALRDLVANALKWRFNGWPKRRSN